MNCFMKQWAPLISKREMKWIMFQGTHPSLLPDKLAKNILPSRLLKFTSSVDPLAKNIELINLVSFPLHWRSSRASQHGILAKLWGALWSIQKQPSLHMIFQFKATNIVWSKQVERSVFFLWSTWILSFPWAKSLGWNGL